MSDTTVNAFLAQFADATERAAFVPAPPTPAAGPDNGYFAYQQDDGSIWCWDSNGSAWVQVGGSGSLSGAALSVLGNATNAPAALADIVAGSDFQVLRRSGTAVGFGSVNLASSNAVTGDLPFANLTQGSALSVLGVTGNATADNASIVAASDFQVMRRSGTAVAFGAVNLASSNAVTGILPVANGGSGSASGAALLKAEVPLTNAEIIALPTAAKELIASPGSGFTILVHQVFLIGHFITGYTGANATASFLTCRQASTDVTAYIANDSSTTPALTGLTDFLAITAYKTGVVLLPQQFNQAPAAAWGLLANATLGVFDATNFSLYVDNSGVNFSGGNAGNSLTVRVFYSIESIP